MMTAWFASTTSRGSNAARVRRRFSGSTASFRSASRPISGQALDAAIPVVQAEIRKLKLPAEYRAKFAGQSQVLDETASNMILAIVLASIFVYMVLVAQFESFVQ